MDYVKEHLKERCFLFLYVLSANKKRINTNTFRRYVYLYYLSGRFFDKQMDEITISIDKGDMKIAYLEAALDDLEMDDLIEVDGNEIQVLDELVERIDKILDAEKSANGNFYELYRSIKPFVNLLNAYDDQFIFTIFFSEPTFQEASERGVTDMKSSASKLAKLLDDFKRQINNAQIDDYDILTHWMEYVLKNYYK